jgi:hypothetical protein
MLDLDEICAENPQRNAADRATAVAAGDPEDGLPTVCTCPCTGGVARRHLGFVSGQQPLRLDGHRVRLLYRHVSIEPHHWWRQPRSLASAVLDRET